MSIQIQKFREVLEKSFSAPRTFNSLLLEELKEDTNLKLEAILHFFDDGNVIHTEMLSDFFVQHQSKAFNNFLVEALSIKRPKQFLAIINILNKLNDTTAIDKIKSALLSDSKELILPTVKVLANFAKSDKVALEALTNFYLTYPDETKLSGSIRYLLAIQNKLVPIFLSKYRTLNKDKKIWALKYLSETTNPQSLRIFDEELAVNSLETGFFCIQGLGKIKTDESVKILSKQCKNKEWFIRKKTAEALGQTQNPNAIEPLLSMLSDTSFHVQAAVIEGISKVGNLMPELLTDAISKTTDRGKVNLIRAMGQLKNEAFVEPLIKLLNDKKTLFFTIDALGDLGFKSAITPLKQILNDKIWFNRLNALEALWKLEPKDIEQIAQKATQDDNDMVRNVASRILGSINTNA